MGFFDKIKSYVGLNDKPTITFERLEKSIPITDTGVKFNINVESKREYTVMSVTSTLKVKYMGDNDIEEEEILAEETNGEGYRLDGEYIFPAVIKENTSWLFYGSIFMDDDANATMRRLANRVGFKLMLVVEVDIKEIGGLFDPSIETEIFVIK